jgi:hypothetical protein
MGFKKEPDNVVDCLLSLCWRFILHKRKEKISKIKNNFKETINGVIPCISKFR